MQDKLNQLIYKLNAIDQTDSERVYTLAEIATELVKRLTILEIAQNETTKDKLPNP